MSGGRIHRCPWAGFVAVLLVCSSGCSDGEEAAADAGSSSAGSAATEGDDPRGSASSGAGENSSASDSSSGGSDGVSGDDPASEAPTASILFPPTLSQTGNTTISVRGVASVQTSEIAAVRVNGVDATSRDGFATWRAVVPLVRGDNALVVETQSAAGDVNPEAARADIISEALMLWPADIEVDEAQGLAFAVDNIRHAVFSIDLETGAREILSDRAVPNAENPTLYARDIELDVAANRAFVQGLNALFAVDLAAGTRTVVSDEATPNSVPYENPKGIAFDGQRVLYLEDSLTDFVGAVNPATGARTVVSSNAAPNAGVPLNVAFDLVLDVATREP